MEENSNLINLLYRDISMLSIEMYRYLNHVEIMNER
ncbi:hypothetical protein MEZE111188_21450 [Mesobacillus zeae]